jgi:glutamine amidotransferase
MNIVAVVDYGMCNLDSVRRAVEECGGTVVITSQAQDLKMANRIILPGVGAFSEAMHNIQTLSLDRVLYEQAIGENIPLLGICLGMQLLANKGWEGEETDGLGLIPGEVRRLEPYGTDTRIPHVGWNEVHPTQESPFFRDISSGKDFYFVHSYHFCPENDAHTLAYTPYAGRFVSVVQSGSVFGVQFHPEKSQKTGFQLLKNFLAI